MTIPIDAFPHWQNCSRAWIDDCMQFHGEVLIGRFAHWCGDFDDLPVDETCEEWPYCACFDATRIAPHVDVPATGSVIDLLDHREVRE